MWSDASNEQERKPMKACEPCVVQRQAQPASGRESRRSALSMRRWSRNSAREVNMR